MWKGRGPSGLGYGKIFSFPTKSKSFRFQIHYTELAFITCLSDEVYFINIYILKYELLNNKYLTSKQIANFLYLQNQNNR
jgi:hypothetical protein